MPSSTPTLLLTSSIFISAPFVKLADPKKRVEFTLESIKQWMKIVGDLNIVICDGSGYDFTKEVAKIFPQSKIECINFKNDAKLVSAYGKGYGEGEIIQHALANSEYLNRSDYFVKCTSKIWVKNAPVIFKHWNNIFQCQFGLASPKTFRNAIPQFLDTRFYIANKSYYMDYFSNAYKNVRDQDGYYLEHCFRDVVLNNKIQASRILFPTPPLLVGVSGTSGETYRAANPIKARFKNFKTHLKLRVYERFYK
jgi:hypothetical protein